MSAQTQHGPGTQYTVPTHDVTCASGLALIVVSVASLLVLIILICLLLRRRYQRKFRKEGKYGLSDLGLMC